MELLTSAQNQIIKHLKKLKEDVTYRKEKQSLLIEGKKIVLEAFGKGQVKILLVKEGLDAASAHYSLKEHLVEKLSTLRAPEGYFAEIEIPKPSSLENSKYIFAIDQIQDPGNLGTIFRTAYALGFDGCYLLDHSVDPYNSKVIRASMGACLNIPIRRGSKKEFFAFIEKQSLQVYLADMSGQPIDEVSFKAPFVLVLGNESRGCSLKDHDSFQRVSIPIENIDSLNVAITSSIMMYQMKKSV